MKEVDFGAGNTVIFMAFMVVWALIIKNSFSKEDINKDDDDYYDDYEGKDAEINCANDCFVIDDKILKNRVMIITIIIIITMMKASLMENGF